MAITLDNLDPSLQRERFNFNISTSMGESSSMVVGLVPFTGYIEQVRYFAASTSFPLLRLSSSVGMLHDSSTLNINNVPTAATNLYSASLTRMSVSQNMPLMLSNASTSGGFSRASIQVTLVRTIDQEVLI